MGKKLKGGRRQILQLEEKKPPKPPSKSKVKKVIHYSDSDEDSKKSNDSEASSMVQMTKDVTPLDSEVADFFKEIDALTVPEELIEQTSSSPVEVESTKPYDSEVVSSGSQSDATDILQTKIDCSNEEQKEDVPCAWQEICDDSTGYSYYWNMYTNEVTWDCPDEYAKYVQSLNSAAKNKAEDPSSEAIASKKTKRKKEPAKLPEGAIIPISYYGNSSSDDTSDSESGSPKFSKRPKIEKPVTVKKTKVSRKQDSKRNVDEESHQSEIIGPQLPPDFQFPEERVQMGPFLPSNYANVPEETGLPEANGVSIEASTSEASSGKGNEMNSCLKVTEEIHDSSVNKVESVFAPTSNIAFGYRPVVDYDSFTDDEDEDSENAVSSSHIETTETKCSMTKIEDEDTTLKNTIINIVNDKKNDEPDIKIPNESKVRTSELKTLSSESLPKELKRRDVDIDSLFAAHSSYGKHGFGFGWREQPDTENEVSSPSRQERKSYRTQMKSVSFVKSKVVLDFGSLNEAESYETANKVIPVKDDSLCVEQTSEKCPSHPEMKEEMLMVKDSMSPSSEEVVVSSENVTHEQECEDAVMNKNEDTVVEDHQQKAESRMDLEESSSDSSSFELTDDLDEIDRVLCEALYKKKAKNSENLPSTMSNRASTQVKKNEIETPAVEPLPKCQKTVEKDSPKSKEDSDLKARILETASVLVDKLTFLLSNSTSTLPSLNSLYIQLQTRFVDWQANALDSIYFEARLSEVNQYLHHYETGVVSGSWTCQWDRVNKRYFYLNHLTQVSQWTFPEELFTQDELPPNASKIISSGAAEEDRLPTVSSSRIDRKGVSRSPSPPPPPPGVDSPPPPPPSPPATPPPLPNATEREPEDMDLENSNDSNLAGQLQSPEHPFIQNPAKDFTSVSLPLHASSEKRTLFPILNVEQDTNPCPSPGLGSEVYAPIPSNVRAESSEETPTNLIGNSGMEVCPAETSIVQHKTVSKPAPVKRKKTKIQPGLGLRKKNIPSLVEKWQKIKEEQEREDSNSNESKPPIPF